MESEQKSKGQPDIKDQIIVEEMDNRTSEQKSVELEAKQMEKISIANSSAQELPLELN